ncbi:MAG: peptidoglycan editing factor PgeF [Syntrophomonadaceae bacterium]|nr:peptidoglycan editing factor PgeF [Syntrophomonadaceae bacterium]
MRNWEWKILNGMRYITLPEWEEQGINIAFSTREGGTSAFPFVSLNLGLHVGDRKESVLENRRRFLQLFNGDLSSMVCCQQVHGDRVAAVDVRHAGRGALEMETALPGYDAMVTATPSIFLASFFADCLPIYFFDPFRRSAAIAHSGWKGTMSRIAANTAKKMEQAFGCDPVDIKVFIGPGIGKCCFKVSEDIVSEVKKKFVFADDIININEKGYTWDLAATNRRILVESGIKSENIITCDICTSCNTDIFYSYRRENGRTGRMGAVIGLK